MKRLLPLFGLLFVFAAACGQKSEIYTTANGAIDGYDPVAYFTEKKPVAGRAEITAVWKEQTWRFASQKNKELFVANPEKYAPQYGGYCAYGMAGGYKAKTEADAWAIVNDKLYLNYNKKVQKDWLEQKAGMIEKADKNWPTVRTKE